MYPFFDVIIGNVPSIPVHNFFHPHHAQQGTDDRKLTEHPGVQQAHREGFDGRTFLPGPTLAVKDIGHRGDPDGGDTFERIALDVIRGPLERG